MQLKASLQKAGHYIADLPEHGVVHAPAQSSFGHRHTLSLTSLGQCAELKMYLQILIESHNGDGGISHRY